MKEHIEKAKEKVKSFVLKGKPAVDFVRHIHPSDVLTHSKTFWASVCRSVEHRQEMNRYVEFISRASKRKSFHSEFNGGLREGFIHTNWGERADEVIKKMDEEKK